jgi:EC042_2821-lke REase
VGVVPADESADEPLVIARSVDPNESHPYLQRDVVEKFKSSMSGFTSRTFQAIVWKYGLRDDRRYCWEAKKYKGIFQWSGDTLAFIKRLTEEEIAVARREYSQHLSSRMKV